MDFVTITEAEKRKWCSVVCDLHGQLLRGRGEMTENELIDHLQPLDVKLRHAHERIAVLEKGLSEARSMLAACQLDEPDDEFQDSWDRAVARIDAALAQENKP